MLAVAAVTAAAVAVHALFRPVTKPPPSCTVGSGDAALVLSPDQAEDASTIAAVAKRMQVPHPAVTVALATALQESKLHNYPFGDRDSLGLFQQRPSQGWGSPAQLLTPSFAAEAFYRHLAKVDGWQNLPVAQAAQSVQHSFDGSGYQVWVEEARAIARALTGETTGQFSCRFANPGGRPAPARLTALANRELGRGALHRNGNDWQVAQWISRHAHHLCVNTVKRRGQRDRGG